MCVLMWGLQVHYISSAMEHKCAIWQHICSVIYFKYVYSAYCQMVDYNDFICGTYMYIHLPYKSIRYLAHLAYMPYLVGTFVSSTYLAIT